jgi:hypothetical protein
MIEWHGDPPTHLSYPALTAAGLQHAFTTRHHGSVPGPAAPGGPFAGGGPAVAAVALDGGAIRYARQVHGTAHLPADAAGPGLVGTADALVATRPDRPLAIFTADCLAVVLADPSAPVLGMAHAGWRGTVGGILGRLVASLVADFGTRPERLRVAIGPSIGPCCYEVDEPVAAPLRAAFPADAARWLRPGRPGHFRLDLWQASADQLARAGVRPDAVANARLCTGCRPDLFFSYRREGRGRSLAALARLR